MPIIPAVVYKYLAGIGLLLIVFVSGVGYGRHQIHQKELLVNATAVTKQEVQIQKSEDIKDVQLSVVTRYVKSKPVTLRVCPNPVQAPAEAPAAAGSSSGELQPVLPEPSGDGTGQGQDYGPVFSDLFLAADAINLALIQQQSVK